MLFRDSASVHCTIRNFSVNDTLHIKTWRSFWSYKKDQNSKVSRSLGQGINKDLFIKTILGKIFGTT